MKGRSRDSGQAFPKGSLVVGAALYAAWPKFVLINPLFAQEKLLLQFPLCNDQSG